MQKKVVQNQLMFLGGGVIIFYIHKVTPALKDTGVNLFWVCVFTLQNKCILLVSSSKSPFHENGFWLYGNTKLIC